MFLPVNVMAQTKDMNSLRNGPLAMPSLWTGSSPSTMPDECAAACSRAHTPPKDAEAPSPPGKRVRSERAGPSNPRAKKARNTAAQPSLDVLSLEAPGRLTAPASPAASCSSQTPSKNSLLAKPTREVFRDLVATLDTVLPVEHRSCARPNGAGSRSLGTAGRSVHDVLADVVRAVAARRAALERKTMLQSCGALSFEVEMPGWVVTSASPGAELLFENAPWGSMEGQSLADFVHSDDLGPFNALWSSGHHEIRIQLMYFPGPDAQTSPALDAPPFEAHRDSSDDTCGLPNFTAPGDEFGASFFDNDPLLCDLEDASHSTAAAGLSCCFVETNVHVLDLPTSDTSPRRALVTMCVS